MGYGDARAKKSRVHTRLINSMSEEIQQHETVTIWGTESGLWGKLRLGFNLSWQGVWLDTHLCIGANPEHGCGDGCPGHRVGLLAPSTPVGMDAWVHQSVIDGSQLIFGLGFNGLSKLSMGQARWLGEHSKSCWHGFRFCQGWMWSGLGSRGQYAEFNGVRSDQD